MTDAKKLLDQVLAEYDRTIEQVKTDPALSESARLCVIECCRNSRGAVKAFVSRLSLPPKIPGSSQPNPVTTIIAHAPEAREAPESCPDCFDRTDCSNVDICKAVEEVCAPERPSSAVKDIAEDCAKIAEGHVEIDLLGDSEQYVRGYDEACRDIAQAIRDAHGEHRS